MLKGVVVRVDRPNAGDGLNREFNVTAKTVRISDTMGNYISFSLAPLKILDVKLPFSSSSKIAVMGDRGMDVNNNELIGELFKVYQAEPAGKNMFSFAGRLLIEGSFRTGIYEKVARLNPEFAKGQKAAELRKEVAELKAEEELEQLAAEKIRLQAKKAKKKAGQ